ncbi:glycoside hydrolase family 3 N-terminal domain-containing protein [Vibrio hippocampi]|uniref:Beta-xylosidase n=1 Tax=Vibrio hippocampi TaxID=654686 RepID=A0ABM8ZLC8_9VIBR|nr:glycoside hydrolase family 3 N-terminal domain-containing protein [Vibrio hippocampi]CAH0528840.1 Putative beta-xylosidase [Vibrio hippocampi]
MNIYQNSNYSTSERVENLLSLMTFEEKVAQMGAQWLLLDAHGNHSERELEMASNAEKPTIKERLRHGLGQITRPLGTHSVSAVEGVKALNSLQKYLVEETRLGIPAISHEECLVGLMAKEATLFPSSLNYGHTWNPELMKSVGECIRDEVKQVGAKQGLAPVLDVSRDVRWGRTEETLGEDPYHVGVMATKYVEGLQGEKRDLLATLKHYVGHSYSEGARNHAPVNLGFKELNDTFLLPFEMAVKLGKARSIMPAYHDIDGEACHGSHFLLTEVLRNQWGFDGLIVADYGGIDLLAAHHHVAEDGAGAAALAFNAGLDVELPDDACTSRLALAVEKKLISLEKIDEIVRRILTVKFDLGLFENPYTDAENIELKKESTISVAYQTALESITLLENDGTLPLAQDTKLGVLGATANDQLALLGGYSFPVHLILSNVEDDAKVALTILDGLRQKFSSVKYQKGCDILTERHANAPVFPGDVDMAVEQNMESPVSKDASNIPAAITDVCDADVLLVCVGDLAGLFQTGTVGEGSDTDSLDLPGVQQELIDQALATGKPVVVLVSGGRPYNLGGAEEKAAAVIMAWAPGQEGARAIADVLAGDKSPSGRLTLSIPKNVGAIPYFYNHKLKSSGTPIAYHFGSKYCFGYGLSYANFDYQAVEVVNKEVEMHASVQISAVIHNSSEVDGEEVVQLYVRDKHASVVKPIRELKGFKKLLIPAGATRKVEFSLPTDMLNLTDQSNRRVVEPGEFEIMIGRSSKDIIFSQTINLIGDKYTLPKYWRMECLAEVTVIDTL